MRTPRRATKAFAALTAAILLHVTATAPGLADPDKARRYITLRAGTAFYLNPDSVAGLELKTPSGNPGLQFGAGIDIDRHIGIELALDQAETTLRAPGVTGRLADYSMWTLIPQLRVRFPMRGGRLVPYLVAGAGVGFGEFNDFNPDNGGLQFSAGQDANFIAALGVGVEYFVADNIALGMEAKHIFLLDMDISFSGQDRDLDVDATMLTTGLRLYFDKSAAKKRERPAADSDRPRGYLTLRTGGAFFANPDGQPILQIDSPILMDFGAGVGINLNRHWGLEIAGEYYEPVLSSPGFGDVIEQALWTFILHARYRYPVLKDRVVPYALAGAGVGFAEINDRRRSLSTFLIDGDTRATLIGSLGGGIEYFVTDNISVGVEARYVFGFDNKVLVQGRRVTLDNDTVLAGGFVRVFFP